MEWQEKIAVIAVVMLIKISRVDNVQVYSHKNNIHVKYDNPNSHALPDKSYTGTNIYVAYGPESIQIKYLY